MGRNSSGLRKVLLTASLLAVLLSVPACQEQEIHDIQVFVDSDHEETIRTFCEYIPFDGLEVLVDEDPIRGAEDGERGAMHVALVADGSGEGCYRIDGEGRSYTVHGDAPLGVQYGLAHLLELWGFRFYHPFETRVPDRLSPLDGHADLGVEFAPQMSRRGLHVHTLHPIEGLEALWLPGDENLERASRILDWTIKNRGNYLQWAGLDDIIDAPQQAERWASHTRQFTDEAHRRGVEVGLNLQLFGSGNLQNAFDLIEGQTDPVEQRAAIEERIGLLDDVGLDLYSLSFGEFFGEDPQTFIDTIDRTYEVIHELDPEAEASSWLHVGNYEDLQVEYQGDTYQYYLLAQFADPAVVPWVHTVMYYDLFEDAGGAYLHDEFDEHRELLLQRLRDGLPVGYAPESAYWCAFDSSVPVYLPLYMRSRWLDLARIAEEAAAGGFAPLDEHVLFTTGWEWGYWQNDYATLRLTYSLAGGWEEQVRQMYAPAGDDGAALAEQIIALAEIQHDALIDERLAAYLAGRDAFMDAGAAVGIVSMPDRTSIEEIGELDAAQRAAFEEQVLDGIARLAEETWAIDAEVEALASATGDPWFAEVADGVRIDALRASFVRSIYDAALSFVETGSDDGLLAVADLMLAEARDVVDARHAAAHDERIETLTTRGSNPTLYQYGYLYQAQELCFWHRERIEAARLIEGSTEAVPGCAM